MGKFEWAQYFASAALAVSLINAYLSYFRRARLKVWPGDTLLFQVTEQHRLRIKPELTLHNPGVKLAVAHQLVFELHRIEDNSREPMVWEENLITVFSEEGGRKRDTRFDSFPGILFVPGGSAITKRLMLTTEHPYKLEAGDYRLSITIQSDGTFGKSVSTSIEMRFKNDDIDFLEEHRLRPENETRRILLFSLRHEPANRYLRAPNFK